jgi:anti-sigma factor RsiW
MRCAEFERRLHEMLDEHPDGSTCAARLPTALEGHAAKCEDCRSVVAGYRGLFAGLAAIAQPVQSSGFTDRVLADAEREPWRREYKRWLGPMATAASIAIVLSLAIATRNQVSNPVPEDRLPSIVVQQSVVGGPLSELAHPSIPPSEAVSPARLDLEQASFGIVLNLAGNWPLKAGN